MKDPIPLSALQALAQKFQNNGDPTLDDALQAIEQELPPLPDAQQAQLALELFCVNTQKQNADRIVAALENLTMAIQQLKEDP